MSVILFNHLIGPIPVDVILKEGHTSSLGITELPIETGAKITDHSYVEPKRLELEFASQHAALTYMALVRFQETRIPFAILSGLNVYRSMLIKDLRAERDAITSCILKGSALLQEVIMVATAKTQTEGGGEKKAEGNGTAKDQATKDRTDGTVTRGDQPTTPEPNNQSLLYRIHPLTQGGKGPMALP